MSVHLDEQPKWGRLFVIGSAVAVAQVGTIVVLFGQFDSVNDWLDPYLLYPLSLLAIYFTAPVLFIGAMMLVANRLPAASDSNQITGGKTARIMRDYGMIFVSALALFCIALLDLSVLTLINWINDHQMQDTALGSAFLRIQPSRFINLLIFIVVIVIAVAILSSATGAIFRRSGRHPNGRTLFYASSFAVIPLFLMVAFSQLFFGFGGSTENMFAYLVMFTLISIPAVVNLIATISRSRFSLKTQTQAAIATMYLVQALLLAVVILLIAVVKLN